jgi:hypothetical protein
MNTKIKACGTPTRNADPTIMPWIRYAKELMEFMLINP